MRSAESYLIQGIRVFLGTFYLFSGLNWFFGFYPQPSPGGIVGDFTHMITDLGLFTAVKVMEAIFGFCILFNIATPIVLIALFPIAIQISFLSLFHEPSFFPKYNGLRNVIFHVILFLAFFQYYASLFVIKPKSSSLRNIPGFLRKETARD